MADEIHNNELTLKVFEAYAILFDALQQEAQQAIEDVKQAISGKANAENERKIKEWVFAYYAFERQGGPPPYFKW
ncbi:MAG: hypothetical protein ABIL44_12460 [candidate division WOR-3 bacterium]